MRACWGHIPPCQVLVLLLEVGVSVGELGGKKCSLSGSQGMWIPLLGIAASVPS